MESTLATVQDAELILKLYDLRREEVMRKARNWVVLEFNPQTIEEFMAPLKDMASQQNAYFRQVTSYWEMAASFVLHGALNADLFLDTNGEPFLVYAKFQRFLPEIRKQMPHFMHHLSQLIEQYPSARQRVEFLTRMLEERQAAARQQG
jgi:hypothetical protein